MRFYIPATPESLEKLVLANYQRQVGGWRHKSNVDHLSNDQAYDLYAQNCSYIAIDAQEKTYVHSKGTGLLDCLSDDKASELLALLGLAEDNPELIKDFCEQYQEGML